MSMEFVDPLVEYSPKQLAHILSMMQKCGLDAALINAHNDKLIAPEDIKQSGMVYIEVEEQRFPAWVRVPKA